MFQGLRAKVTGALHAALGDDRPPSGAQHHQQHHQHHPHLITSDRRLARAEQLVAAATSTALPPDTPDWGATLELVDMINADPPGATPLVLVPLHRVLAMPTLPPTPNHASSASSSVSAAADAATSTTTTTTTTTRQLLALATLEALVKNCRPQLHTALVNSPLWRPTAAEGGTGILAAATAGSSSGVSGGSAQTATIFPTADVRDRALALVEDLARGLPHEPRFMRDYEALVDAGVDFPARAVGGEGQGEASSSVAPYYSAPPEPPVAAATDSTTSSSLTAADRVAIAAAQAELEREAALRDAAALGGAAAEAGHHPGDAARLCALGPTAAWAGAIRPPGYAPPASAVASERAAAAAVAAAGGVPTTTTTTTTTTTPAASIVLPSTDAELRKATQVAANSAELLREMVAPLAAQAAVGERREAAAAAREALLADLADQCHRYRSLLQEAVAGAGTAAAGAGAAAASTTTSSSFTEEATAAALAANDDLQRALLAYEAVAAGRAAPTVEQSGGGGGAAAATGAAAAAGATAAAAAPATTTTTTPAAFTLGDDDDDANDEGAGLASTRAAMAGLGIGGGSGEARGGSK